MKKKHLKHIGILIIALAIAGVIIYAKPEQPTEPVGGVILKTTDTQSYFAEIKNGKVIRVIVADQEFIDSGAVGNPNNWKRTYKDGFERKNYAGKRYDYDVTRDAFISKRPHIDAILDEETARWIMPVIDNQIATTT